jgi:hypothetical protein
MSAVALTAAVAATGFDVTVVGLRYIELAVFVLWVADSPGVQFFFGIPGWVIAAVIVGSEVLDMLAARAWALIAVLAVALGVGLVAGRTLGLAEDQRWIPSLAGGGRPSRPSRPSRSKRTRRRADPVVVPGPWVPSADADQVEVDRLLDKISSVGMSGLSADEQRRLREASERLRRRRD